MNSNRFIIHADITISTTALGDSTGSSELQSITKHEIGHAYGIGHSDFGDLMSPILTDRTDVSLSACDINAVTQANIWKTARKIVYAGENGIGSYRLSVADFIKCK